MQASVIGGLAISAYLLSTFFTIKEQQSKGYLLLSRYFPWLAAAAHGYYSSAGFLRPGGFNFSLFNTASLISLIVVLLLLIAAIGKPVRKLGIILYPIAALMVLLDLTIPIEARVLRQHSLPMDIHIMASIIAFGLLNIAAIQAILLAIQDRQLRNHHPHRFALSLPPLQTMESLLFQMIAAGLFFLTISLVSGFVFIEDLFAQHLVHKTVLAIIAWVIFTGLLLGRLRFGWRGQTAIRWTMAGFIILLLAYFGSKLVLELILDRA